MPNSPVTGETMEKRLRELTEALHAQIDALPYSQPETFLPVLRQAADIALEEAEAAAKLALMTASCTCSHTVSVVIRSLKTPGEQIGEGE